MDLGNKIPTEADRLNTLLDEINKADFKLLVDNIL